VDLFTRVFSGINNYQEISSTAAGRATIDMVVAGTFQQGFSGRWRARSLDPFVERRGFAATSLK